MCGFGCIVREGRGKITDAKVSCADASFWGCGVTEKIESDENLKKLCAFNERWRFDKRSEFSVAPRTAALGPHVTQSIPTLGSDKNFGDGPALAPSVEASWDHRDAEKWKHLCLDSNAGHISAEIWQQGWHVVLSIRWKKK